MSIYESFCKRRKEGEAIAKEYEKKGSLEMAYIALWSITEHTVKEVGSDRLRKELKEKFNLWCNYLNNGGNVPNPIKDFSVEVRSIPPIKHLEESLGRIPAISKLLQTQAKSKSSKYRDKRNAIAHHAEKFTDEKPFEDYKQTALDAIVELDNKLSGKENGK